MNPAILPAILVGPQAVTDLLVKIRNYKRKMEKTDQVVMEDESISNNSDNEKNIEMKNEKEGAVSGKGYDVPTDMSWQNQVDDDEEDEEKEKPKSNGPSSWTTLLNHVLSVYHPEPRKTIIKAVRSQKVINSSGYATILTDISEYSGNVRLAKNVYLKPFELNFLAKNIDSGAWTSNYGRMMNIKKLKNSVMIEITTEVTKRAIMLRKQEIEEFKKILPQLLDIVAPFLKKRSFPSKPTFTSYANSVQPSDLV